MSEPSKRDAIIERIRALGKMTTQAGCSEHEAATASALLHKLMQQYNVSLSEIELRAEAGACVADYHAAVNNQHEDWFACATQIARLFEVHWYCTKEKKDHLGLGFQQTFVKIVYYGLPADVQAAITMSQIVGAAVNGEGAKFGTSLPRPRGKRQMADHANKIQSFRLGMIHRLQARITELAQAPKPTGYGLIVLKGQLVEQNWAEYVKAQGLRFGVARFAGEGTRADPTAYARGHAQGDNVRLGHHAEVYGNRQLGRA